MKPQAELHLQRIKNQFIELVDAKYRKGQEEHGGLLTELTSETLCDHAIEEAIDQVVYLLSLKDKLEEEMLARY